MSLSSQPDARTQERPRERSHAELVQRALAVLATDPVYRVFRAPSSRVVDTPIPPGTRVVRCLFVDAQAGGLDAEHAPLLELAALPVTIGRSDGQVYRVGRPVVMFSDPGEPIPDAVVRRTGITDRMVRGHRLSPGPFTAMLRHTDAVVAFNAAFDRPLLERFVPGFAAVAWLCAYSEIDWPGHGLLDGSLESLCARHASVYLPVRRSIAHVDALLDLVTTPWSSGSRPIVSLFDAARSMRALVWASSPRFECNAGLRDRQYRFHQSKQLGRGWYTYVAPSAVPDEIRWLTQTIYGGRLPSAVRAVPVGARLRHASLARVLQDAATSYLTSATPAASAPPSAVPTAAAA